MTGQTTLPYISNLPPWAREVLGPFLEYTLELIGVIIRWFLYPFWRLLPGPLRYLLAFVFIVIMGSVMFIYQAMKWLWNTGYAFGEYLSRYRLFRGGVLFSIFALNHVVNAYKHHWRSILASTCLVAFWYFTTPEDEVDPEPL